MAFAAEAAPLRHALVFAALRGRHLHRVFLGEDGTHVMAEERLFRWQFGRLRDVVQGPDGWVYVLTSNTDGRGLPGVEDDRVLRVRLPDPLPH